MNISTSDARALYTKMLIDVYKERTAPKSFLRSFFRTVESATLFLSIEVQRGTEKIAVDVERGTEGNRNSFSKSTEKIFAPPYYREFFDATELDLYDRLFGSTEINEGVFAQFLQSVADKLGMLQDKIERSYELQCSQVLQTGIVLLNSGININFKRKAESIATVGGSPWSTGSVSPYDQIETAGNFLRQKGKAQGGLLNVILGSSALSAFMSNTIVTTRSDIRNFSLDNVAAPQRNSVGATLHGQVSCGSYLANLWSYPEFYDNSAGDSTPYIDPKKMIVLPEKPNFVLGFAAVPQLIDEENPVPVKGAFIFGDYKDKRKATHIYDVKSAGVAIPVAVDQIYTRTVLS